MKKIILSLTALLAVGVASAQSYPKQPDRTVVNYVEYKKEAKPDTEQQQDRQDAQTTVEQVAAPQQQTDEANAVQPATSVNGNTVSENRREDKRRKE